MRDGIFYSVAFGFIGGVLLQSLSGNGTSPIYLCILIAVCIFLYSLTLSKKAVLFVYIPIFFVSASLGMFRFEIAARNTGDTLLNAQVGQTVSLVGVVVDEPDVREKNTKLTVEVNGAKILVTVDSYPVFYYGDEIKFSGRLMKPENFIASDAEGNPSESGRMFDYISYLRKDGIFYLMNAGSIEKISEGNGSAVRRKLFTWKESVLSKINREIPEPESALMGGLILGTKQSLGQELRQDFIRTGTIHIVALSGYNVTIVAEAVMRALGTVMAKTVSIYFGIGGIILFAIMTGAGSTVVRASLMAILALIARALGRNFNIGRALLIAGFVMVASNPWILCYDVSFQLSFLATIGLIYLTPKVKPWFYFVTEKFGLREVVSATVATNIFVLPFILYKMGILSIVALPANLLVLPLIPYTMLFGFLAAGTSFVSHIFALPFGIISYAMLHYELWVIKLFSELPFAAVTTGLFPVSFVILIYAFYGWWIWMRPRKDAMI